MNGLWHWLLWVLAAFTADPRAVELEHARAAGYANVAYAALAEAPAPPPPAPPKPKPTCRDCDGNGKVFRTDGGYVRCPCKKTLP